MILRRFMQHIKEQNWFAVGLDVIVVVVGIFLGMQVSEWNENRKLAQEEIKHVTFIIRDLALQEEKINIYRSHLEREEQAIKDFLTAVQSEKFSKTLFDYAKNGTRVYIYRPGYPTYEGLRADNSLQLIKDQAVKDALINFHEESVPFINDLTDVYLSHNANSIEMLSKYIGYKAIDGKWALRSLNDLAGLKNDHHALNVIARSGFNRASVLYALDDYYQPRHDALVEILENYLSILQEVD